MKTLVVMPTYNEAASLARAVSAVHEHAPECDVLVVDDNSPDGTGGLADELARSNGRVHVVHRPGKLGLGTAYVAGFRWALEHGYDAVVEMDADLSHPARRLPAMLSALEYVDFAVGSRYVRGGGCVNWPFVRWFLSRFASIYVRALTGLPVRDSTAGFIAWRRRVLESLDLSALRADGYGFQVEMKFAAWRGGFKFVELPITFVDRIEGESKMSHGIIREAAGLVCRLAVRGTPVIRG